MKRARGVIASLFAIVFLAGVLPARAQDFPTKPITIVVPLAPGSGMDTLVRLYADKLQQPLGKPDLSKTSFRAPADAGRRRGGDSARGRLHLCWYRPASAMAIKPGAVYKKA